MRIGLKTVRESKYPLSTVTILFVKRACILSQIILFRVVLNILPIGRGRATVGKLQNDRERKREREGR